MTLRGPLTLFDKEPKYCRDILIKKDTSEYTQSTTYQS